MDVFDLPSPLWNKVFEYVLNSRDSTVADLLAATAFQPHFANFELKSVEFQATNNTSVVRLGINGRQPMEVHLTELDLARKTLLPFLHKTTNFTVVGVNKDHKWLDALFWTEASELIEHLVIADSQISPFLLEFVAKSYAHNVSFIKCTSTQDFTFNMDWHTESLLLYECSPVFVARIAEKAMYSTTDLQQFEVHMNFLDESVGLNRVKFLEGAVQEPREQGFDFELTYWKKISQVIVANPEITVALYVQDCDLQLAFMLLLFYRNRMLDYAEYQNATSTLKMSPRSTVAYGRIFMTQRLFINGHCHSPRKNDMVDRYEAELFLGVVKSEASMDTAEYRALLKRLPLYSMYNPDGAPTLYSAWLNCQILMSQGYTLNAMSLRANPTQQTGYDSVATLGRDVDKMTRSQLAPLGTYSRKIFIGGLPRNESNYCISAAMLTEALGKFGPVAVDWPNREEDNFAPNNGFAFAIFDKEESVHRLLYSCQPSPNGEMLLYVIKADSIEKKVQIRPWVCKKKCWINTTISSESFTSLEGFTTFIGGVPRIVTGEQLASTLMDKIGNVAIVEIETDRFTNYPKGTARVVFASREAYVISLARRLLTIDVPGSNKEIEIKPYLSDQFFCDRCRTKSGSKFCAELPCLKYFCNDCWDESHKFKHHQPMLCGSFYRGLEMRVVKPPEDRPHFTETHLSSSGCSSGGHRERTTTASESPIDRENSFAVKMNY